MYICLKCGAIGKDVNRKYDQKIEDNYIHCHSCGYGLTDIDDDLVWYIYKFNKAKLNTIFCCSGHPWERYANFYIVFKYKYKVLKKYFNDHNLKTLSLEEEYSGKLRRKTYIIRFKNAFKEFEKSLDNKFEYIDDLQCLSLKHDIYSELRNLVCELCIK